MSNYYLKKQDKIFEEVLEKGTDLMKDARAYALGSGNSIPESKPVEGYLPMINVAVEIRKREFT